jgi:hypothetical protein
MSASVSLRLRAAVSSHGKSGEWQRDCPSAPTAKRWNATPKIWSERPKRLKLMHRSSRKSSFGINADDAYEITQILPPVPVEPSRVCRRLFRLSHLLDKLAEGEAEGVLRQVMDAARGGDMRAAEIVLARIWPVKKGRLVSLKLPPIKTAQDIVEAVGVVADAVGAGEIHRPAGTGVRAPRHMRYAGAALDGEG